jgi:superfamily II DNA or RNA helicase
MALKDQPVELWKMNSKPISVGGGAIYPFKEDWMEIGERKAKYPDENGNKQYNLFRVIGNEEHKRILVPRNMVTITPDIDQRVRGIDVAFKSKFQPRNNEQIRVVRDAVELLRQGQSFMLRAPTGFGKTYVGSEIIARVGKKAIVVVTKEDIVEQWLKAFHDVLGLKLGKNEKVGIIAGDTCDTVGKNVVIAMVQSLAKEDRYPEHHFRDFGLFMPDECHRIGADFFSQACFRVPAHLRCGISATPRRKDGREEVLHAHIGPVRVFSDAVPMNFRVIVQQSPWSCPRERRMDREGRLICDEAGVPVMFTIKHSAGACGDVIRMLTHHHERNKVLLNFTAHAYQAGRKILFQSDTKDHLERMASMLPTLKVPVSDIGFYVGGLKSSQREKAMEKRVIFSTYQMTAEATDIPDVDTLVMGTPKSDVEQIVGRILRLFEGKKEPLVFDLRDDSSPVFSGYGDSRDKFYRSRGAAVKEQAVSAPQIVKQGKSVTIAATKGK